MCVCVGDMYLQITIIASYLVQILVPKAQGEYDGRIMDYRINSEKFSAHQIKEDILNDSFDDLDNRPQEDGSEDDEQSLNADPQINVELAVNYDDTIKDEPPSDDELRGNAGSEFQDDNVHVEDTLNDESNDYDDTFDNDNNDYETQTNEGLDDESVNKNRELLEDAFQDQSHHDSIPFLEPPNQGDSIPSQDTFDDGPITIDLPIYPGTLFDQYVLSL